MSGVHLTKPPFAADVIPIDPKVPLVFLNIIEAALVEPLRSIAIAPKALWEIVCPAAISLIVQLTLAEPSNVLPVLPIVKVLAVANFVALLALPCILATFNVLVED